MKRLFLTFGLVIAFFVSPAQAVIYDNLPHVSPKTDTTEFFYCGTDRNNLFSSDPDSCESWAAENLVNGKAYDGKAYGAVCEISRPVLVTTVGQLKCKYSYKSCSTCDVVWKVYNYYVGRYEKPNLGQTKSCPPDDFPLFTHGYDVDGDGEIDRCYNPEDFSKIREPAELPKCTGDTFTPSTTDEVKINQAIQDLIDQLASIESDFSSQSSSNSCQLNNLAQLFGISEHSNPNFALLTNSISRSLNNIKDRLNYALTDLSGVGLEPRYLVQENYSGPARAVHCRLKSDTYPFADDDIVFVDEYLQEYGSKADYDEAFRMDILHEIHHSVGAKHPERTDKYNEYTVELYRSDFEEQISLINQNLNKSFATPSWLAERYQQMMRNPYNLAWAIGAVKCK